MKRAFNMKWKAFFISFKGLSTIRNCLRPESGPLECIASSIFFLTASTLLYVLVLKMETTNKNGNYYTDYLISYSRSKSLFSLILSNYSWLKVPNLSRNCLLFMLLLMCGGVERLPGLKVMKHFSSKRGIKIDTKI